VTDGALVSAGRIRSGCAARVDALYQNFHRGARRAGDSTGVLRQRSVWCFSANATRVAPAPICEGFRGIRNMRQCAAIPHFSTFEYSRERPIGPSVHSFRHTCPLAKASNRLAAALSASHPIHAHLPWRPLGRRQLLTSAAATGRICRPSILPTVLYLPYSIRYDAKLCFSNIK